MNLHEEKPNNSHIYQDSQESYKLFYISCFLLPQSQYWSKSSSFADFFFNISIHFVNNILNKFIGEKKSRNSLLLCNYCYNSEDLQIRFNLERNGNSVGQ